MIRCVHCGRENEPIFKYCLGCGKELEKAIATASPREEKRDVEIVGELLQVKPDGSIGEIFHLKEGATIIGKDGCDLNLNDKFLSNQHLRILLSREGAFVEDLKGFNGTYLRIRGEVRLKDKDFIRLGQGLFMCDFFTASKQKKMKGTDEDTEYLGSPVSGKIFGRFLKLLSKNVIIGAYFLKEGETKIGRTKGDIILGEDPFISSTHCVIIKKGNDVILKDLGSVNGTFVKVKSRMALEDGDSLLFGMNLFKFKWVKK